VPTPPKTSDAAIVRAARALLERSGSEGFSLQDVAKAVGVKTPSLYKHIVDRAALLASLERQGYAELGAAVRVHAKAADPLRAMAVAYRRFALSSPQLYARMLAADATRSAESVRWRQEAVQPVLAALMPLVGKAHALRAARTVTAFLHGYVTMEMTGAFRLGGNVDRDFSHALDAVLRGIRTMK
jgi:AcrR family transcriptional regulator